jgi:predicted PurR-regulated permease PerM
MMDLAQNTYSLVVLVAFLVLLVLVLVIVVRHENRSQHERLAKQIAELPPSPEGTERIMGVVESQQEMTRQHISNTFGSVAHETEMNKGLLHKLIGLYQNLVTALTHIVAPSKDDPK